MPLKARPSAVIGLLVLRAVAMGVLGLYAMGKSHEGLKTIYEDRTAALD